MRYTATEYDSKNRVSQYSYLDGQEARTESYTYNEEDGTVKSYTVSNGDKIAVDYDALNRVSKKSVTLSGSSSPAYEVQVSYVDKSATQTTPLVKSVKYDYSASQDYLYGYEYDNIGNITRAYHQTASESVKNAGRYLYDEQNQLEYEEVYEDGSLYTLIYTYDTYGNIREVFKASGVGYDTVANVWMYGYPEKIGSYRYADEEGWADLLTEYNGYTLRYDEIGNPITYYSPKRNEYCYMNWNGRTLLGMTAGSDTISYTYDADGQRTGKKVGTDSYEYIYYGDKLISYVADGQYEMHFLYDETGSAYGFTYKSADGNGTYYYVLNGQGDVVQLRNSAQEIVANYHYDAWGKLLSITNAAGQKITNTNSIAYQNPIRYRGYVYDEETGFYYLNSRYYDPQIKRFINADGYISTGQGFEGYNMFAYCGNNPVNKVDSTGEFAIAASVAISGLAVATTILGVVLARKVSKDMPRLIAGLRRMPKLSSIAKPLLEPGYLVAPTLKTKSKAKEEEKDITGPSSSPTTIYRYYSSKTENLAPRPNIDYDGLSFSTNPPRPGISAVVTTIEAVNSTGILQAIPTGGAHVVIIPTTGTVEQWMNQGQNSVWSKTLSSIVLEWDGGN